MAAKYKFTAEQMEEIATARKKNKDKNVDARLKALEMRASGSRSKEVSIATGFHPAYVSTIVSKYINGGIDAIVGKHYGGNRRNISVEEEQAIIDRFLNAAQNGQILEVSAIKNAYESAVGHHIGNGQIYRVLQRHGIRKVMPRSRHPKAASPEAIEASKKLKPESEN